MDCIFCKIIEGSLPSRKIYEDDDILAFYDINPAAPIHAVIIPKTNPGAHIPGMDGIDAGNSAIVAKIFAKIPEIAGILDITNGYRVICNNGADAGQTVSHLHFHLLAGKTLGNLG